MATTTVTCVRCKAEVPANQADFSADGMLCRSCAAGVLDHRGVAAMEASLARSTARKHILIGAGSLTAGIAILAVAGPGVASSGSIAILPGGLLIGGLCELIYGLTR